MVSQCANPKCGAPFLYLREGRLIALRHRAQPRLPERVEFFWLCGKCANHVTLDVVLRDGLNHASPYDTHAICFLRATSDRAPIAPDHADSSVLTGVTSTSFTVQETV